MSLKTILVCLTTPEHAGTLLNVAIPLARRHGAHLIGLHTIEALLVYPGIAMHIPEPAFSAFNKSQKEEAEAIREVFEERTRTEDFVSEFRMIRAEAVSANERMVECARAADLVIMAHEDKDVDRYDQRHAQIRVIRESGRPVVIVPLEYDGPELGSNILLGWADTREAARAAHDMRSMAQEGADVTVLRVGKPQKDRLKDSDGIDITEALARHGFKTTLMHRDSLGERVADVMNEVAFQRGADMIAVGAFGHSMAYDLVIGSATHTLLRAAKLPVLFST